MHARSARIMPHNAPGPASRPHIAPWRGPVHSIGGRGLGHRDQGAPFNLNGGNLMYGGLHVLENHDKAWPESCEDDFREIQLSDHRRAPSTGRRRGGAAFPSPDRNRTAGSRPEVAKCALRDADHALCIGARLNAAKKLPCRAILNSDDQKTATTPRLERGSGTGRPQGPACGRRPSATAQLRPARRSPAACLQTDRSHRLSFGTGWLCLCECAEQAGSHPDCSRGGGGRNYVHGQCVGLP